MKFTDNQVINIFEKFNFFELCDWVNDFFRIVLFNIVKLLYFTISDLNTMIIDIVNLQFFNYIKINELHSQVIYITLGILTISLTIFGIMIILKKKENILEQIISFVLIIIFIFSLPMVLTKGSSFTNKFKDYFLINYEASLDKVYLSNFYDLKKFDDDDFKHTPSVDFNNNLDKKRIKYIDINERVRKPKHKEIFFKGYNGFNLFELNYDSKFLPDIFDRLYYRWQVNWLYIILYALAVIIVLLTLVIKVCIIIFELGYYKIFGTILIGLTASVPKKAFLIIKEILKSLVNFIVIFIMLNVYNLFLIFLKSQNLSFLKEIILVGSVTYVVLKGDMLLNRIFDVQNSSSGVLFRSYIVAKTLLSKGKEKTVNNININKDSNINNSNWANSGQDTINNNSYLKENKSKSINRSNYENKSNSSIAKDKNDFNLNKNTLENKNNSSWSNNKNISSNTDSMQNNNIKPNKQNTITKSNNDISNSNNTNNNWNSSKKNNKGSTDVNKKDNNIAKTNEKKSKLVSEKNKSTIDDWADYYENYDDWEI